MKTVFSFIGFITSMVIIVFLIVLIVQAIGHFISYLNRCYHIKHRFDKPPLAKCYCKDCEYYCPRENEDNGPCSTHEGWYVADCWFCWAASPKVHK